VTYWIKTFLWMCLALAPTTIYAQSGPGNDDPSFTDNLGMTISLPVQPTSQFVSAGLGINLGAGYNFDRHNALVGEFMWNWLYPSDGALEALRAAAQTPNIDGHGNLYALTANYKYELRGKLLGAYLIGGGGWYHRTTSLTMQIPSGTPAVCNPIWFWWGYSCSSGILTKNITVASSSSSAFGVNAGIGFTIRVGEPPYRFYVESRYHYAPTKNISTQVVAFTFGFRY
jgi:opacity protein-like surface antigen